MISQFFVPGIPKGKGRPKFSTASGFVRTYTPSATVEYENLVRLMWVQGGCQKLEGEVSAGIVALFPYPKSMSKKKRSEAVWYTHKPDCDNIAKIILDALNGIAYDDDAQVVALSVKKVYTDNEVGCRVTLQNTVDIDM